MADAGSWPSSRARARLLALSGLSAVALLLFPSVLRGWTLSQAELRLVFLGQVDAVVRCVSRGAWPVWDPRLGFGQPLLANPASQALYPATWAALLTSPDAYLTLYVLGHLVWAGIGLSLLARHRLGLSRGAAVLAGAAWMASGPLVSHVQRWQELASVSWLPWVLLAASRAVADPGRGRVLVLAAALSLQGLAGSGTLTALTLLIAVVWTTGSAWPAAAARMRLVQAWGRAGALALALTAAQWVPALDLIRHSARSEVVPAPAPWSVHPARWLELLAPSRPPPSGEMPSLYLGATLGGLVLWAVVAGPRRRAIGLVILAAAAAALATGSTASGGPWLAHRLDAAALARAAGPLVLVTSFAWALLSGLGLEAVIRRFRSRHPGGAGLAACFVVSLLPALGLGVVAASFPESLPRSLLRPTLAGGGVEAAGTLDAAMCGLAVATSLAAAGLASLGGRRPSLRPLALVGLALLAVGDVLPPGARVNPMVPASLVARPPETAARLHEAGAERIHVMEKGAAPEERLALAGRSAGRWGFAGSYELEPLALTTEPQVRLAERFRAETGRPSMVRLLQAGAVSDVVTREPEMPGLVPRETVDAAQPPPVRIFQVPGPLPRSYVVGHVVPAEGEAALEALLDPDLDLRTTATLEGSAPSTTAADFAGTSWIATHAPDRVELSVDASAPGYLVLVDGYDPGWKATVDGEPSRVLRANYGFRAVAVPAGEHVVQMRYRPAAVTAGALVSSFALAGILLAGPFLRARSGRA